MADLKYRDRLYLEKMFEMGDGYVLDFSNNTFRKFIQDSIGIDTYEEKYAEKGESKANRLRTIWNLESNYDVGILIDSLLEYIQIQIDQGNRPLKHLNKALYEMCQKISERLKSDGKVENLNAIKPNSDEIEFRKLADAVHESIKKNEPEAGLDRLHTFVTRYVRNLCDKHGIKYSKETPLHSLFGGYVKHLSKNGIIESKMTELILKSSISVLEAFNQVRNDKSYAHDNSLLNYSESILILNDVANVIRFIEQLEK